MRTTHLLLSALAGSALTIAMVQGHHLYQGRTAAPRAPRAPLRERADRDTQGPRLVPLLAALKEAQTSGPPAAAPQKEENGDQAADEVEALRLQQSMAQQRLAFSEGTPVAWPKDVPEGLRAKQFEDNLRRALAESRSGELDKLSCEEYPCIALIRPVTDDKNWPVTVKGTVDGLVKQYDHDLGVGLWSNPPATDTGKPVTALSLLPPGAGDPNLQTRTGYRARNLLSEAGADGNPPQP